MEEKIYGEQLESNFSTTVATASIDDISNDRNDLGSPNGKFKTVESLQKAYENLEREFTKKSQALSELQKSIDVDNVEKSTPEYSKENWREKTKEFLENNPEAQKYTSEISEMLVKDKNLACLPNSLELAFSKILASKYKSNEDLIKSNDFLNDYVYNNEEIVGTIVKKYLENVNANKVPPIVLKSRGTQVGFVAPTGPSNLTEAKMMVEKLFSK